MKKHTPSPFRIEWEAHEYEYKERSQEWFWAMGIVTVAIAVTSVIFHNIIFGILVLVGAFSLALFVNREPEVTDVVVDERGITKGKIHYPYSSLHSFWMDSYHSHPRILLRSQKAFLPLITVPLGDADHDEVAEALSHHIKEEHHAVPLVEKMLEFLGF